MTQGLVTPRFKCNAKNVAFSEDLCYIASGDSVYKEPLVHVLVTQKCRQRICDFLRETASETVLARRILREGLTLEYGFQGRLYDFWELI